MTRAVAADDADDFAPPHFKRNIFESPEVLARSAIGGRRTEVRCQRSLSIAAKEALRLVGQDIAQGSVALGLIVAEAVFLT
jgi:hypothetical protein